MDGACRARERAPGWYTPAKWTTPWLPRTDSWLMLCSLSFRRPATGLGQGLRGSTVSTRAMKACSSVM